MRFALLCVALVYVDARRKTKRAVFQRQPEEWETDAPKGEKSDWWKKLKDIPGYAEEDMDSNERAAAETWRSFGRDSCDGKGPESEPQWLVQETFKTTMSCEICQLAVHWTHKVAEDATAAGENRPLPLEEMVHDALHPDQLCKSHMFYSFEESYDKETGKMLREPPKDGEEWMMYVEKANLENTTQEDMNKECERIAISHGDELGDLIMNGRVHEDDEPLPEAQVRHLFCFSKKRARRGRMCEKEQLWTPSQMPDLRLSKLNKAAEQNTYFGTKFLNELKGRPEVLQTESGVMYKVTNDGDGPAPLQDSIVYVRYEMKAIDCKTQRNDNPCIGGTRIDLGSFMGGQLQDLMEGFREVLPLINQGGAVEVYLPYEKGYGSKAKQYGMSGPGDHGKIKKVGRGMVTVWNLHLSTVMAPPELEEDASSDATEEEMKEKVDADADPENRINPGNFAEM